MCACTISTMSRIGSHVRRKAVPIGQTGGRRAAQNERGGALMLQITERLEQYRLRTGEYGSTAGVRYGAFFMPGPCGRPLRMLVDDGAETGWEHVSVST